ncbi:MAG: thioredoxin family protein [Thiobacillaceae bacterium]
MTRLLAALVWIVAWGVTAALAGEGVPAARDLQLDGDEARARGAAVLVVFVGARCPYCDLALNEVLIPLSRNPDYQRKLVMRRVQTRSGQPLRDFDGKRITQGEFAKRHGVFLVPTVMLFDHQGQPLTKPMVGITTVDHYGYELDLAIEEALARIGSSSGPTPAQAGSTGSS